MCRLATLGAAKVERTIVLTFEAKMRSSRNLKIQERNVPLNAAYSARTSRIADPKDFPFCFSRVRCFYKLNLTWEKACARVGANPRF